MVAKSALVYGHKFLESKTYKTYKSFPMFEKSENIRLIRLIRGERVYIEKV